MFDKPIIMVLPIVAISLIGACTLVRPVRAVVERENQTLHVESARLSGLPERRVIVKNLLPGIIAPVAQSAASVVPYLLGGPLAHGLLGGCHSGVACGFLDCRRVGKGAVP